ncbi:MAG: glycosyltransferase family 39 protein [bacterium]|nr:glycosyltransferase family 39 protein [bacterium]
MMLTREGKIILLLFALALLVRVALFGANIAAHEGELLPTILNSEGYYELANNILAGHGFSQSPAAPYVPDSLRPPLYPLFIAAFVGLSGSYWPVIIAQILLASVLPLLARRIGFRLTQNTFAGNAVGVLFAVEPVLVRLSGILLTETLFLALFLSSVITFFNYLDREKLSDLAASAALLGLATLTRPVTQYLPVVIIAFLLWHFRGALSRRAMLHVATFIAVFVVALLPWLYRNAIVFGNPSVANTRISNFYGYFAPSVLALERHIGFTEAQRQLFAEDGVQDYGAVTLKDAEHFTNRAKAIIKTHPKETAKLLGITTFAFFTHDGYLDVLQDLGYMKNFSRTIRALITGPGIIILAGRMFWTLTALLAFLGTYLFFKREKFQPKALFALLLITYFAATAAIVGLGITARYRVPANVFIAAFAFYAIARWRKTPEAAK